MSFDFLQDPAWITAVTAAVVSVPTAIASCIVAVRNAKQAKMVKKALEDAKEKETYVICPECKKKVLLRDLAFHLPSGALDNNLNGIADDLE